MFLYLLTLTWEFTKKSCSFFTVKLFKFYLQESLHYFGERRTDRKVGKTFQGVETPSQVFIQ